MNSDRKSFKQYLEEAQKNLEQKEQKKKQTCQLTYDEWAKQALVNSIRHFY